MNLSPRAKYFHTISSPFSFSFSWRHMVPRSSRPEIDWGLRSRRYAEERTHAGLASRANISVQLIVQIIKTYLSIYIEG